MTLVHKTKASGRRSIGQGLLAASLCLLVAGCTVGPNYKRPDAPVPPAYKENNGTQATVPPPNPPGGTWKPAQPADDVLRGKWWELYGDPQLNALEDKVAVSNQNLKAAIEQYLAARDQVKVSRAAYYPTLSVGPTGTRERQSQNRPLYAAGSPTTYSDLVATGQASWEPDLWGSVRRSVEASRSNAQASAADLANVELSIRAELATRLLRNARPRYRSEAARRHGGELPSQLRLDGEPTEGRSRHRVRRLARRHSVAVDDLPKHRRRRRPRPVRTRDRHADRSSGLELQPAAESAESRASAVAHRSSLGSARAPSGHLDRRTPGPGRQCAGWHCHRRVLSERHSDRRRRLREPEHHHLVSGAEQLCGPSEARPPS